MSSKLNGKCMKPWPLLTEGKCPDPHSDVSVAPDGQVYVSIHCLACCVCEAACGRLEPQGDVITLILEGFEEINERFANQHGYTFGLTAEVF